MTENNTQEKPALHIIAQYIKDLSLEAPEVPFIFEGMTGAPEIAVNIDVQVNKTAQEHVFTVDLVTKINATRPDNKKTVFLLEMTYGTLAEVNTTPEHLEPMLLVEVPHLIFPSVRAVVASTTREAGLPPLQINPINFAALYLQRVKAAAETKAETKPEK